MPLAKTGWLTSLGRDLLILGRHPVFVLNMLAYCPVQGAFGSYIFWGPKVLSKALVHIRLGGIIVYYLWYILKSVCFGELLEKTRVVEKFGALLRSLGVVCFDDLHFLRLFVP